MSDPKQNAPATGKMGGEGKRIVGTIGHVSNGRSELSAQIIAALSAPVSVGDGEAVAWQRLGTNGWVSVDPEDISHYREKGQKIRALGVIHPSDPDATERMRALVEACLPIADKARQWDERHGSERRDSVQIQHRIGDFRRIRDLLDQKACGEWRQQPQGGAQ